MNCWKHIGIPSEQTDREDKTMETEARLTKLASCAGCGAKVGAGTLASLLKDFRTRTDPRVLQGASPRASLALTALSKATAWIQGRDYVTPRDVRFVFSDCIEHRLIWSAGTADASLRSAALGEMFQSVKAPAIK